MSVRVVPAVEEGQVGRLLDDPELCVLVVDDHADTVESIAMLFKMSGYETHTAATGAEALEQIARYCPDIVLLDLAIPKPDGYEVARAVRARPLAKSPLLIAVTGLSDTACKRQCAEAGFDLHLSKPVGSPVLDLLPLLACRSVLLRDQFNQRAAQHAAASLTLVTAQIEMADIFLSVASTTSNPDMRQRCLDKAEPIYSKAAVWLAALDPRCYGFDVAVKALDALHERLAESQ